MPVKQFFWAALSSLLADLPSAVLIRGSSFCPKIVQNTQVISEHPDVEDERHLSAVVGSSVRIQKMKPVTSSCMAPCLYARKSPQVR